MDVINPSGREYSDEEQATLEWVEETYKGLGKAMGDAEEDTPESRVKAIEGYLPQQVEKFARAHDLDPNLVIQALLSLIGSISLMTWDILEELHQLKRHPGRPLVMDFRVKNQDDIVKTIDKLVGD